MTAVSTAPTGVNVCRWGRVYGYLTWRFDPDRLVLLTGVEFGYGGQTRQRGGRRDLQHRDCQPWADIIADGPIALVEGAMTGAELDAIERAVIGGDWRLVLDLAAANPRLRADVDGITRCAQAGPRPRYNIADGGLDNPDHIPQWTAREQRWARDDAAERPRWVAPEDRPVVPVQRRPVSLPAGPSLAARARAAVAHRLAVWWSRVWPWVAGWTTAAVAVSAAWLVWVDAATVPDAATVGPVTATGLVGWVASRRKPKRRSKARKTGRREGGKR